MIFAAWLVISSILALIMSAVYIKAGVPGVLAYIFFTLVVMRLLGFFRKN